MVLTATGCLLCTAAAPSFDCNRSQSAIEQTICADETLSRQDRVLAGDYAKALAAPKANKARLTREQLGWLHYRDATCGPDPIPALGIAAMSTSSAWRIKCLTQVYEQREGALEAPTANDPLASSDAPDALCDGLMRFVPPPGTLVDGDAASIIAAHAGRAFVIDPLPNNGLSVERPDSSEKECPAIRIYQSNGSGRSIVEPPKDMGDYCGEIPISDWPDYAIADIDGTQALLERSGTTLSITRRTASGWATTCSINLKISSAYSISQFSCQGSVCASLSQIAPRLAELMTRTDGPTETTPGAVALWHEAVSKADEPRWKIMREIGLHTLRHVPFSAADPTDQRDLVYFDDQNSMTSSSYGGVDTPGIVTAFVPIASGDELLLGKIGAYGFGCCRTSSTELLSVYRLVGGILKPIAGFVLEPTGHRIVFAEAN